MLHPINYPLCKPHLDQILRFQRNLLEFACSPDTLQDITEESVADWFGNDLGAWVWRKLFYGGKKTTFGTQVEQLIAFVQGDNPASLVQEILDAFDNDIKFHENVGNDDFQFAYRRLPIETQSVLKDLMIAFYENLLRSGFESVVHGQPVVDNQLDKLDRNKFVTEFWKNNDGMEVCPACDEKRADVNLENDRHFDDADHYLPKKHYPFLAIHPSNLVPICSECNRSFKGERDPIDDHADAPMSNAFFPYVLEARRDNQVKPVVQRDPQGVHNISIQETSGVSSRRVTNLSRVFQFDKRLPNRLKSQIGDITGEISTFARHIRRFQTRDEQTLREELQEMLDARIQKLGKRPNQFLQVGYLTFVLEDEEEFQDLYEKFSP